MDGMQYILFDLDGTLTDSGPGIINAIQYALKGLGMAAEDPAVLAHSFIGPPLTVSFPQVYGFSPERTAEAIALFHEYYDRQGVYENQTVSRYSGVIGAAEGTGKADGLGHVKASEPGGTGTAAF